MNVNPFAPTQAKAFHPDAVYRINVDNGNDSVADVAFSFVFSQPDGGHTVNVYHATGEKARGYEAAGNLIIEKAQVCFGATATSHVCGADVD